MWFEAGASPTTMHPSKEIRMSKKTPPAPKPAPIAVASSTEAVAASDVDAAPTVEPTPDAPTEAPSAPVADEGPAEPAMPEAPIAAPAAPIAAPIAVAAPVVEYYRVREACRYVRDGVIVSWPRGMVIDSLNFNLADVRAQGIPLDAATAADIDTTPAIGHRSV